MHMVVVGMGCRTRKKSAVPLMGVHASWLARTFSAESPAALRCRASSLLSRPLMTTIWLSSTSSLMPAKAGRR